MPSDPDRADGGGAGGDGPAVCSARFGATSGGLQGKLLIIHGTGDDNVHFQGTQRLLNRLIELNWQFGFMEYPNRRHGISGLHIDTLRWEFITQHLPAGPR